MARLTLASGLYIDNTYTISNKLSILSTEAEHYLGIDVSKHIGIFKR